MNSSSKALAVTFLESVRLSEVLQAASSRVQSKPKSQMSNGTFTLGTVPVQDTLARLGCNSSRPELGMILHDTRAAAMNKCFENVKTLENKTYSSVTLS